MNVISMTASSAVMAGGEGVFTPPNPTDFWQPLIGSGAWAFTRPMALLLIAGLFVGGMTLWMSSGAAAVPSRKQYYLELLYDFVRNSIARDMIGGAHFKRFLPLLFALFTFILVNNLMGVIPPFQNPPMARIGFPIALTLVAYIAYHYVGLKRYGLFGYFKHMIPPGLPLWIAPVIFVLELITYFITRPLTLALRLFGNMFAGHMVLVLFILGGEFLLFHGEGLLKAAGVASLGMGVLMTVFELLIQFLQAYVFTLLTASYIATALADDH